MFETCSILGKRVSFVAATVALEMRSLVIALSYPNPTCERISSWSYLLTQDGLTSVHFIYLLIRTASLTSDDSQISQLPKCVVESSIGPSVFGVNAG